MRGRKFGRIINISSINARQSGVLRSAYKFSAEGRLALAATWSRNRLSTFVDKIRRPELAYLVRVSGFLR
jgi:NAD(P)-dependent dehydrogenase (short-subunit alcohol dehydrogenase family)